MKYAGAEWASHMVGKKDGRAARTICTDFTCNLCTAIRTGFAFRPDCLVWNDPLGEACGEPEPCNPGSLGGLSC
jgi:hypothetical protein